jgi:hypothetical protein
MTEDALFSDAGLRTVPVETEELTAGEQLRRRQAARIDAGQHPLAIHGMHIPLHPDAPRTATPDDGGTYPRCGTCRFRRLMGGHAKSYPKCLVDYTERPLTAAEITANRGTWQEHATKSVEYGVRVTGSTATDVKAWWPACHRWEEDA